MKIVINSIKYNNSLVDGPGIRTVLFLQGCNLRCKGCQNKSAWDIKDGTYIEIDSLVDELNKNCRNKKLTISGGEPLFQLEALRVLLDKLQGFDIALYTGHDRDEVPDDVISKVTYLKTGSFIEELKTSIKPYVGSENQIFEKVENKNETVKQR